MRIMVVMLVFIQLLYIVMCAILRVVAYILSVTLLHIYMYTVFVALCVAPHFPLKE